MNEPRDFNFIKYNFLKGARLPEIIKMAIQNYRPPSSAEIFSAVS